MCIRDRGIFEHSTPDFSSWHKILEGFIPPDGNLLAIYPPETKVIGVKMWGPQALSPSPHCGVDTVPSYRFAILPLILLPKPDRLIYDVEAVAPPPIS